ncbi:MAG: proteasome accessory factor PafA2 family protein [Armatimonadota bacterium]
MASLQRRLMGIETEYGIHIDGLGPDALVKASRELVESHPKPFASPWEYRHEHPRRDARGFVVDHLSVDPIDARYDQAGTNTTDNHLRADRMLPSGARLYNDHGHPEYSTPETFDLLTLVAADKAGERIMQELAVKRSDITGKTVSLQKNNSDGNGASYGTHESYQALRSVSIDTLIRDLPAHFATRILYTGAGKTGCEESGIRGVDFQLSQRADFFKVIASVDTLFNRPLVNTRDETHDDPAQLRRIHVICGDANLSETATFLKCGTTHLVLRLIEDGVDLTHIALADPLVAIKEISRNPLTLPVLPLKDGNFTTALEVQYTLLGLCRRYEGTDTQTDLILSTWKSFLDDYAADPLSVADRADWAAKLNLLQQFAAEEGVDFKSDIIQSLDIAFHDIDPDAGLHYALVDAGDVKTLVTESAVNLLTERPPQDSPKAMIRGHIAKHLPDAVVSISWDEVTLKMSSGQALALTLHAFSDVAPERVIAALTGITTADALVTALKSIQ